jgi:transposase
LLVDPDQRTTRMALRRHLRADDPLSGPDRCRRHRWTTEDRRRYAPAIQEVVRQGMLVRLAVTIDAIDPPASVGRPRVWPTLVMLQALWHVARDDRAWRRLPPASPPHQTVWSRLMGWRQRAVLDRALQVLVACRRLAAGRKRRPTAAIVDTQTVKVGPQRGPRGYDANKKIPTGLPAQAGSAKRTGSTAARSMAGSAC